MRKQLAENNEKRLAFRGTFERFGEKRDFGHPKTTVLLINILDEAGKPVCDHLWFNLTKAFSELDLQPGDVVEFHARVKEYVKGYRGHREDVIAPVSRDYKLSYPTHIRKIDNSVH